MNTDRNHNQQSWFLRIGLGIFFIVMPLTLRADAVLVSAIVQVVTPPTVTTKVIFKGYAFPSSTVTVRQDGTIAVQTPADPAARFDVELNDVTAGTHSYDLQATDAQGRVDRASNFTITVTEGTTTTLSGIFLGPTIAIDKEQVRLGDTVTMLGTTVPVSTVSIVVSSVTEHTFTTNADSNGVWTYQFVADVIGVGTHSARAKATAPTSEVSAFSDTVSFAVLDREAQPCDGKRPGDLNCDGRVNLTDFSVLLFFWKQHAPSNTRADINTDGIVDIRDLSIMLFWWTK